MRMPFELAHLSDTHLGRRQYPITSGTGRNAREVDFSAAFVRVVEDIASLDLPLTIHSGDWFDNSRPAWRHVILGSVAAEELTKDGRVLVVAGGNHDMPAEASEACALELYGRAPRVHVATNRYRAIDLSLEVAAGNARPELDKVVVHLLPHDALKTTNWDDVQPWQGYTNILVSHCVVGGTALYRRSIGREYSLPIDIVTRGWDYVALGHYHKQGPVAVGGLSEATTPAWYAGSTENNGFSDVRDSNSSGGRGYLRVNLDPAETVPQVTPVDLPIRAMFRLPVLDAAGMTHEQVTEALISHLNDAALDGAVVRQVINNLHPDTWGLVDIAAVRAAASSALWYDPKPEWAEGFANSAVEGDTENETLGSLAAVLEETLIDMFGEDSQRAAVADLARDLLGGELAIPALEQSCCDDGEHTHDESRPEDGAAAPAMTGASGEH